MPLPKAYNVCVFMLLITVPVFAQQPLKPKPHNNGKLMHTRTQHNYNVIKISRAKAKTVCPIFEDTGYPYQAIGIKLGDPFAVTYKYYPSKHFSFGVDFGHSASGLYSKYYKEIFNEFTQPDTLLPGQSVAYMSHQVNTDWVAEAKILYHIKAEKINPGLQAYAGMGWEFRNLNIDYSYLQNDGIFENQIENINVKRFTYGVQGTVGIEFSNFSFPVSAFMELEMYVDLLKDPGFYKLQGGVGLRYVF